MLCPIGCPEIDNLRWILSRVSRVVGYCIDRYHECSVLFHSHCAYGLEVLYGAGFSIDANVGLSSVFHNPQGTQKKEALITRVA